MQKNKIGLGLITCDRKVFFEKSFNSLLNNTKDIKDFVFIVINDGNEDVDTKNQKFIKTEGKIGVGKSKNIALKYLKEQECEHLFLMEDDIEILSPKVFECYINASNSTGIKHFNYGLHGNHNKTLDGTPTARRIVNYPDDIKVVLYPNILGAFSYYHVDTIDKVGYMDEQFYNALEHVDHTYQIIKEGFHPHFRWFADVLEANSYLNDILPDHQESKIRSEDDFMRLFLENHDKFVDKNKFAVVYGRGPAENNYTEEQVMENLKEIWKKHHKK